MKRLVGALVLAGVFLVGCGDQKMRTEVQKLQMQKAKANSMDAIKRWDEAARKVKVDTKAEYIPPRAPNPPQ